MSLPRYATEGYFSDQEAFLRALKNAQNGRSPPMTSVLTPVQFKEPSYSQAAGAEVRESLAVQKEDTKEYLADMLRELSAIAQWAQLSRAQAYIEAALHEIDS